MLSEFGAKATGSNDGRGGSMQMVDFSEGIFGTNGMSQFCKLDWQLRGEAGDRQVDRVEVGLQHNIWRHARGRG